MPISFVATRASVNSAAAGTVLPLPMAAGASITPGNTLILQLAYRDAATPPTDQRPQPGTTFGGTGGNGEMAIDQRGNLWRRVAVASTAGGSSAADNGAVVSLWICHVTFAYTNADSIFIQTPITAAPMTHVSAVIFEFSGIKRTSNTLDTDYASGASGTASSVPLIRPAAAGQLVFGALAVGSNPTLVGDADGTDGAWSAIGQATTGGGGITRGQQTKAVTGTTVQTWDVTWAGAQPWAAVAVVFEEAVVPWPTNNVRLANPNYPCPSGPEIIPVGMTQTPVDTGTAYIFDSQLPTESSGVSSIYWNADLQTLDPTVDSQHCIVAEVYEQGYELLRETPTTINFGVPYAAVLQGGATTTSGSAVAALAAIGGNQVILEVNQSVDCYFDFSSMVPYQDNYRVLNARINYVAWKDDSSLEGAPGEGLGVRWRDENAVRANASSRVTYLHGAWLVNDYQTQAKRVYKNLGEINGLPVIGAVDNVQYTNVNACFTLRDFIRMNAGDATTMLTILGLRGSEVSQTTVFLDTIQLELTLVPEKRLAQSARRVSSGVGFPDPLQGSQGRINIPMYKATDTSQYWTTPTDGEPISVVLREGVPASPSDWFAAQYDPTNIPTNFNGNMFRYASQERVGPSMAVNSVVQPRETLEPQVVVSRAEWTDGQIAPNSTIERVNEYIHSFTLMDWNSYQAFWPQYNFVNSLDEGISTTSPGQTIVYTDSSATFDAIKMILKVPDALDAPPLIFSIEQPLATVLAVAIVSRDVALEYPEIANGYREVLIPLNAAITPPAAGAVYINMTSATPAIDPWVPAVAVDSSAVPNMSGRASYTPNPTLPPIGTQDMALVLCCPIPDIDADIESSVIDIPGTGTTCVVTPSTIPCITVNNASDYDWLEITRIVSGIDVTPLTVLDVAEESVYPQLQVLDEFDRIVAGGWGSAPIGGAWTASTPASFAVTSGNGIIQAGVAGTTLNATQPTTAADMSAQVSVSIAETPTVGVIRAGVMVRAGVNPNNDNYRLTAEWNLDGSVLIRLRTTVGGVPGVATTIATLPDYALQSKINLKLRILGTTIHAKWWMFGTSEPDWQATGTIATLATGKVGVYYERAAGNTSANPAAYFDNFEAYSYVDQPVTFCDYGVPWDLPAGLIAYQITGYRDTDHRTTTSDEILWLDTSVSPGAAFGLATEDGLFAYVPGSDSGELTVTWNPLTPMESMPLAGRDYQIALRPAENRGLAVTVNVIVDKIGLCVVQPEGESGIYDESLPYDSDGMYDYPSNSIPSPTQGAKAMAPTPFNQIRSLERQQRVELKLPGGHTRFVFVDVGACVIIPRVGTFMSEITLTDSTPPDTTPEGW